MERLQTTKRTEEKIGEYLRMSKDGQAKIKDIGGFVGGVITGGRRLKNSISCRYLITLDVDKPDADFISMVELLGWEAMLYTTHKHSVEGARYRLIMPMEREVLPDEYEAVSRKVASILDIEAFDPTTFQPERLMFWPSTAVDGEYIWERIRGRWLNPDEVLERYADWRDSSQWAVSQVARNNLLRGVSKQEDPLLKVGLIGIFCREYGIKEAIEQFIPDEYVETEYEDRWTYAHGSTHMGALVYDDKFMYSHHSTDPVGDRLVNSFDMVRIHKYGMLDKGVAEGTPNNKLPSYLAMTDMITKDGRIKKALVSEQIKGAQQEFGVLGVGKEGELEMVQDDLEWTSKLDVDRKGNVLGTIGNCIVILNNDDRLKDVLAYDDFEKRELLLKDLPWRRLEDTSKGLLDSDDAGFRNYFESVYGITNSSKIKDAMDIVIHQNAFHPVRSYLSELVWDKVERIDRLLVEYLGAEDDVYVREVTRKTLVAAVTRVYEPGVKFDTVLTLVGPQGLGKSRWISGLGMRWFSDTFGNLQNNAAMENIRGVWIMEIGEFAGLKKHDVDAIKLFIAKQEDRFRVAYGKRVEHFPRQNIFIASTNDYTPLQDQSGGRRFWPVLVTKKMWKNFDQWLVDQIWAEACYWYAMGEELYLSNEVEVLATTVQSQHTEQDERAGSIQEYLETKVPSDWYEMNNWDRVQFLNGEDLVKKGTMVREYITVPEIWYELIRGTQKDMTLFNTRFIRHLMNRMPGWKAYVINRKPYGTQRGWVKEGSLEFS